VYKWFSLFSAISCRSEVRKGGAIVIATIPVLAFVFYGLSTAGIATAYSDTMQQQQQQDFGAQNLSAWYDRMIQEILQGMKGSNNNIQQLGGTGRIIQNYLPGEPSNNIAPTNNVQQPTGSNIAFTIHTLVNQVRQEKGLPTLSYDSNLANIAFAHSQDMGNRNYFSHTTPDGKDPTERAIEAGYGDCRKDHGSYYTYGIGENIYEEWGDQLGSQNDIAHATFNAWMNSQGHRENILDSNYDREGIGAAFVGNAVYVTEDFC
jgi:uncharacterized protein YkwD